MEEQEEGDTLAEQQMCGLLRSLSMRPSIVSWQCAPHAAFGTKISGNVYTDSYIFREQISPLYMSNIMLMEDCARQPHVVKVQIKRHGTAHSTSSDP